MPEIVPLNRLLALERQFFPMLPDNPAGRDLRAVVLEAISARRNTQVRHERMAELADRTHPAERFAIGADLTKQMLGAVAPIVDGMPSDVVVDAMGAAMMAALLISTPSAADQALVLRRYASRLQLLADNLGEPA